MLPFQAASTYIVVYDVLSGARLGRIALPVPAVELCFTPDGSLLVAVMQVRQGPCLRSLANAPVELAMLVAWAPGGAQQGRAKLGLQGPVRIAVQA
jgi:hypothetical protein